MARALTYAEAVAVLVTHRVVADQNGCTVSHLATYAARQGWRVTTEQTTNPLVHRRWRATVTARHISDGYISGTQGYGATEEEALAIAVAGMARQQARRG